MDEKIALVTDSTCDLPKDILDKLNINFFPLKIIYKEAEYSDRIDIDPATIYKKFKEEIPGTSMPGISEMKEKYLELKEKGFTHIIAVHLSAGLSSTYDMSMVLKEQLKDLITIEVIDSKLLSMGLGRLVLYAREIIDKEGIGFKEIVNCIKNKVNDIELYFVVKTLKYLKEGGRIGKIRGTIGELFNIKPIISIDKDGEYYTFDKSRSRKSSLNKLYKLAKKKIIKGMCYVDVMHADAAIEARELLDRLKGLKNIKGIFLGEISPAMAVHAGPGLIGVCITSTE
ncbi:DegV family protein [Halocella sp. SP3-1]|uniref:DegV family protein n=1 Tax=Halocella sp. SP3-1 TaxID=2382161 RepID=UPI000F75E19D|nr:DegV family protein [Halocella sp. SP3-1]AZO95829.1 DegV family protein [Halocella sp. SP3-1]